MMYGRLRGRREDQMARKSPNPCRGIYSEIEEGVSSERFNTYRNKKRD